MILNLNISDREIDPVSLNPLSLAFMGDAVYDTLVRDYYINECRRPVKALHSLCSKKTCASAQAEDAKKILDILNEQEHDIYLRGRNAHPGHLPKSASVAEYHASTAFEAVFGYLYLRGERERITELFYIIMKEEDGE